MSEPGRRLRVLALYPDVMNIYADWLIETALGLGDPLPPLDDELERLAHLEARLAAAI